MDAKDDPRYLRGARSFVQGRFESVEREAFDDGWTPERQKAFIAALADTGSVKRAAFHVNMSPEGAYYILADFSELAEAAGMEGTLDDTAFAVWLSREVGVTPVPEPDQSWVRARAAADIADVHRARLRGESAHRGGVGVSDSYRLAPPASAHRLSHVATASMSLSRP